MRDTAQNKPLYAGIGPHFLYEVGMRCRLGDNKYRETGGHKNWMKGMPLESTLDSALRHLEDFRMGKTSAEEPTILSVLGAAGWNVMVITETVWMIQNGVLQPELNDLPYLKLETS